MIPRKLLLCCECLQTSLNSFPVCHSDTAWFILVMYVMCHLSWPAFLCLLGGEREGL